MSAPVSPPFQKQEGFTFTFALAIAAVALGEAVQVSNGNLHPRALVWLTIALVSCLAGVAGLRVQAVERLGTTAVIGVLGLGMTLQFIELLTSLPGTELRIRGPRALNPFFEGLAIAAVLAGAGLSGSSWVGRARIPLLLGVHFLLGIWMIQSTSNPYIDVYLFQRDGANALLHGINPYALTFPDIYGQSLPVYGPGVSVNGRLTFGFPYPPLSLLMALPGHLLAGDYRYSQVAAITASGALMAYARPSPVSALAATVFLFTPRVFFVMEEGWTEPFVVLLLALTIFVACRAPKLLTTPIGLLLASKQYLFFSLPLAALLLPSPRWRNSLPMMAKAMTVAAAITIPFALWDLKAFLRDVIWLQTVQPFRTEALSYIAWLFTKFESWMTWVPFATAGLAVAIGLWRAPRSPAGFAGAVALVYSLFFAFNKQAFCNYYFLVIGACCLAVAVSRTECDREPHPVSREPV